MYNILIVGSGVLSTMVSEMLAWRQFPCHITIAARNKTAAEEIVNLIKFTSENLGHTFNISSREIDIESVDMMAGMISEIKPDLIFNTASIQSFWVISELPEHISKALWTAGVGPWTACHAYPAMQLMKAVQASGISTTVVNAAFPDAVNPMLKGIGISPDLGIGNVSNICQPIREAGAKLLETDIKSIKVNMAAHHFVGNTIPSVGHAKGAPYHLCIKYNGDEISQDVLPHVDIFSFIKSDLKRKRGKDGMFVTASSAVRIIEGFFSDDMVEAHAPGIRGLVGGYPVKIGRRSFDVSLEGGISLPDAIEINENGQRYDGIDCIRDGYIALKQESSDVMNALMGFSLSGYHISDVAEVSAELVQRYQELRAKHA